MSRLDYVFFLKSEGVQQVNLAKVEDNDELTCIGRIDL